MAHNLWDKKRWISILLITVALLALIVSQAAAYVESAGQAAKPTPTPTVDPIRSQGSGISITIGAAVLVLIVIFGVGFTLVRQKQD